MMPPWARTTITRLRASTITDHGNEVADWTTPDRLAIPQCIVEPTGGQDSIDHRDGKRIDLRVTAPYGVDVRGGDRIEVPGYTRPFEVIGEPGLWDSSTRRIDWTEILLTVWEG